MKGEREDGEGEDFEGALGEREVQAMLFSGNCSEEGAIFSTVGKGPEVPAFALRTSHFAAAACC